MTFESEPLTITQKNRGDIAIIYLAGTLDFSTDTQLFDYLEGLTFNAWIFEMSEITAFSPSALGILLGLLTREEAVAGQQKVVIANPSNETKRVLNAQDPKIITAYETVDEALTKVG